MGETIKVRIAVGVSPSGAYNAAGWRGGSDRDFTEIAEEIYDGNEPARDVQVHFVIAEIPLQKPLEIDGKVEPGASHD